MNKKQQLLNLRQVGTKLINVSGEMIVKEATRKDETKIKKEED